MNGRTLAALAGLAVFAALASAHTWLADEAFITTRMAEHAWQGHGLRFNLDERVQASVHPLWLALLVGLRPILSGPGAPGILATATTFLALGASAIIARDGKSASVGLVLLLGSRGFMDYATSGVENPLCHLLLVALVFSIGRSAVLPGLLVAGAALTRLEGLAVFLPLWLLHMRSRRDAFAFFLPVGLWVGGATFYYGTPVPLPTIAMFHDAPTPGSGLWTLAKPWVHDPFTALSIVGGLAAAAYSRDRISVGLAAGSCSGMLVVLCLGGDGSSGRLLTLPALAGVLAVMRLELPTASWVMGLLVLATTALIHPTGPASDPPRTWNGLAHQRQLETGQERFEKDGRKARRAGLHTEFRMAPGRFGYYAGPQVHVVDRSGRTDPLLARMPARFDGTGTRFRVLPPGYDPGEDDPPADEELAKAFAVWRTLTREALFDAGRVRTLTASLRLPPAVDHWAWRFSDTRAFSPAELARPIVAGPLGLRIPISPPAPVSPTWEGPGMWRVVYTHQRIVVGEHIAPADAVPPSRGPVDHIVLAPASRGVARKISELRVNR